MGAAVLTALVMVVALAVYPPHGPNPDPHGPYWHPCRTTCAGTVCVGSASGHAVCSLPPGSAPDGYRHRIPPR